MLPIGMLRSGKQLPGFIGDAAPDINSSPTATFCGAIT
jgi:hypothetical protein